MDVLTLWAIVVLPGMASSLSGFLIYVPLILAGSVCVIGAPTVPIWIDEPALRKAVLPVIKKIGICVFVPMIVVGGLLKAVPNERQMMYIVGGYAATNIEGVENLPKNVVNAANRFLETYNTTEEE